MSRFIELINYGWADSFAQALEELGDPGLEPGRVVASSRGIHLLRTETGELWARPTGRFRDRAEGPIPCAGDWLAVRRHNDGSGAAVEAALPRRSALSRAEAGRRSRSQTLAANIDLVLLLMGLDDNYNPARMERLTTLAWSSGAQPVAVLTKADLVEEPGSFADAIEAVVPGVPVRSVSAVSGQGIDELRRMLTEGRTAVLVGSSGVGKSTLLNRFAGAQLRKTREVRATDGRGRHTTSLRELFLLPGGGCLIDTPGLREVGLAAEGEAGLEQTFAEVEELAAACRFRDCTHDAEPGCAVKEALAEGTLSPQRYQSYLKLRRELAFSAARADERVRQERERRWRAIARASRSFKKDRRG